MMGKLRALFRDKSVVKNYLLMKQLEDKSEHNWLEIL